MKLLTIIIFLFNLIIFIFPLSNYSLLFPFNTLYLSELENISLYNESFTNSIVRNIFESNIFIDIKLGTPIQIIKLQINANSDDFFISRPDANFDMKYPKRNGNFYFNHSLSSTFDYQIGKEDEIYFSHPHLSNYVQDNFIFYSTNPKNKELRINGFNFLLAYQVRESQQGVVGLKGFANIIRREDFFTSLKNYNITNNYIWYLKYDNSTNGNLVIGNYPHDDEYIKANCNDCIYKKKHFEKIYSYKTDKNWKYPWALTFKNLIIKNKTEYQFILEDCEKCKIAELDPNLGIIKGSKKYKDIIEDSLFKKYINKNICYKDILTINKNYEENSYDYYYCESSIKNELKNEFNNIIFEHREFKTNFSLDFDDLFFEEKELLFFKMIFDEYYNFIFGSPFINKYQFVFNSDSKEIGFYSKNINNIDEDEEENENKSTDNNNNNDNKNNENNYIVLKIIGIIILAALLILIGIFIGKKLFSSKRKMRMNELQDNFDIN